MTFREHLIVSIMPAVIGSGTPPKDAAKMTMEYCDEIESILRSKIGNPRVVKYSDRQRHGQRTFKNLSIRTENALKGAGVETYNNLLDFLATGRGLLSLPNLGVVALKEFKLRLTEQGFPIPNNIDYIVRRPNSFARDDK